MNAQDLQTIRGYVQSLPQRHGKEDTVRVAVIAEDGTQYHVLHKGAGTSLVSNINANIEITGRISPLSDLVVAAEAAPEAGEGDEPEPGYLITVKSYRLTDGFDDPWYDDAVR